MSVAASVFVIDQDVESRQAIGLLAESMDLRPVAFSSALRFFEDYQSVESGCIVVDCSVDDAMSTEFMDRLIRSNITLPVIVTATQPPTALTVRVMKMGAVTMLEKPYSDHDLGGAIREAIDISDRERASCEETRIARGRVSALSPQELEVLEMLTSGLANKVIAHRLGVSLRTVESRRHDVLEKMKVQSIAELVRAGILAKR